MAKIIMTVTLEDNKLSVKGDGMERITGRQVRQIDSQIRKAIHRERRALARKRAQKKIDDERRLVEIAEDEAAAKLAEESESESNESEETDDVVDDTTDEVTEGNKNEDPIGHPDDESEESLEDLLDK